MNPDSHLDSESLEQYSMGKISDRKAVGIEEHLLVCDVCRMSLEATDSFVAAMRSASESVRRPALEAARSGITKP